MATRAGGAGAPCRSRGGTQTAEEADRERTTMITTMTGAIEVRAGLALSILSSVRGADPRPRPPRFTDRRRTRSPSPAARDRSRSPPRRRRRYSNESRSRSRSPRSRSPPPAPRDGRRRRHDDDDDEDDDDAEGNRRGERRRDRGGEGNRREENGGRDNKGKGKDVVTADDAAEVDAQDIAALMGFGGFGTTQVSHLLPGLGEIEEADAEPRFSL